MKFRFARNNYYNPEYQLGFHIFDNKQDALMYSQTDTNILVKVVVKNMVCHGYQDGLHVYVFRDMKVTEVIGTVRENI